MTSRRELAELLAEVPLFARCTKRSLTTIARHAETAEVSAGRVLCEEGAEGDAFFVLLDGEAVVEVGGREQGRLGRGAHFGELALLSPAPRSATVRVVSDATVALLGARMFRTLVREYPDLSERLLAGLAAELRDARRALQEPGPS